MCIFFTLFSPNLHTDHQCVNWPVLATARYIFLPLVMHVTLTIQMLVVYLHIYHKNYLSDGIDMYPNQILISLLIITSFSSPLIFSLLKLLASKKKIVFFGPKFYHFFLYIVCQFFIFHLLWVFMHQYVIEEAKLGASMFKSPIQCT